MARSGNQKLKLLYLRQILLENTDERHPMTVADMISALGRMGVSAERKSIYDDLEALRQYGLDVVQVRGASTGYYIGQRDFELPELKLLVDSVQSSKFITHKKTLSLIKKIEGLASLHDARQLGRQVYVRGRVKTMNESVYYNVDEISNAISHNNAIRFKYFEYTVDKGQRFRRDGQYYVVSPFALMWDDENYYMIAYDAPAGMLKHFRVDKMTGIEASDSPREGHEAFDALDMSAYSKKVFGMFRGEDMSVRLRFADHLAGAVIDRFGKEVSLLPDSGGRFTVRLEVAVSPQFFGWLFGFGDEVEILSPDSLREEMRSLASRVAGLYE